MCCFFYGLRIYVDCRRASLLKGSLIPRDVVTPLILGAPKTEVKPVVVPAPLHRSRGSEREESQEGCYLQVAVQGS